MAHSQVQASHDPEPTPEFNARGLGVLQDWEHGVIPFQEAVNTFTQMGQEAALNGHLANQARAEHFLGYIQHYRGNLNTSISHYDKARVLFQLVGNQARIAIIDLNQGENYRNKGEFSRARKLYRSAYEMSADIGNVRVQTMSIVNEGLTLLSMKEFDHARAALLEGLALAAEWQQDDRAGLHAMRCEIYHGLATLDLLAGELSRAWEHAHAALQDAQAADQHISIGYAYRILGEVVTELGGSPDPSMPSNPDDYYRAAVDAFRDLNAEGEMARTLYSQAKSFAKRGKRRSAAQLFGDAMLIFQQHGMTDDAAKAAEAQLKLL